MVQTKQCIYIIARQRLLHQYQYLPVPLHGYHDRIGKEKEKSKNKTQLWKHVFVQFRAYVILYNLFKIIGSM